MHLKFVQNMKPVDIAKKLKMTVKEVYTADKRLKVNYKKSLQQTALHNPGSLGPVYRQHVNQVDDKHLKASIGQYLNTHGIYDMKRVKVQQYL